MKSNTAPFLVLKLENDQSRDGKNTGFHGLQRSYSCQQKLLWAWMSFQEKGWVVNKLYWHAT